MLFLRLVLIINSSLITQALIASETPQKRPRSCFETPDSEDKRLSKQLKQISYDDLQIPVAFTEIVDFYDGNESKQSQLKLLGSELWDPSNIRSPSLILTGSLALAFWYCTYEERCEDFLENRPPNDIDVLVDDLSNHSYILIDDLVNKAKIVREEKIFQYNIKDTNIFSYDFILTGRRGLDFGSKSDLYKNGNDQYIPVLSVEKLLELKVTAGIDLKFDKHKNDIESLKKINSMRIETTNRDANPFYRNPPSLRRAPDVLEKQSFENNWLLELPSRILWDTDLNLE